MMKREVVLVFWGCYSQMLQTMWLRTTQPYSPSSGGQRSGVTVPSGPHTLLWCSKPLSQLLVLPASLGHHRHTAFFPPCVYVFCPLLRTPVTLDRGPP